MLRSEEVVDAQFNMARVLWIEDWHCSFRETRLIERVIRLPWSARLIFCNIDVTIVAALRWRGRSGEDPMRRLSVRSVIGHGAADRRRGRLLIMMIALALLGGFGIVALGSAQDPVIPDSERVVRKAGNWERYANGDLYWWNEIILEGRERTLKVPWIENWKDRTALPIVKSITGPGDVIQSDLTCPESPLTEADLPAAPAELCIRELTERYRNGGPYFFGLVVLGILDKVVEEDEKVTITFGDGAATDRSDAEIRFEIEVISASPFVQLEVTNPPAAGGSGLQVTEGESIEFKFRWHSPVRGGTPAVTVHYYLGDGGETRYINGQYFGFKTTSIAENIAESAVVSIPTNVNVRNGGDGDLLIWFMKAIANGKRAGRAKIVNVRIVDGRDTDDVPTFRIGNWPDGRAIVEGQAAYFLIETANNFCTRADPRCAFEQQTFCVKVADAPASDFLADEEEGNRTVTVGPGNESRSTLVMVRTTADQVDEPDGDISVTLYETGCLTQIGSASISVSDDDP